ncbi:DUF427 domain-containing protein [Kineococcus sp. T13]|uniref:DUF427 domain-containing protein n=1 Tax=Kineococcus vitellinus TaxID=2696565 RepID=UPI0014132227|nr:DUF427 domain-containing protein [Kineococcus vitellinus]NAZ74963.1 DUF427 domain-containing protein [Kineococcus vitellinus]
MPTRQRLGPGPDHPITVTPTGRRVVVRVGGTVVADTRAALTLQESTYPAVQYVPLVDVDPAALRGSGTRTWCPYKGEASYRSLVVGGAELTDAVWTYEEPSPAVAPIAGHVAFYPDRVDVAVEG